LQTEYAYIQFTLVVIIVHRRVCIKLVNQLRVA